MGVGRGIRGRGTGQGHGAGVRGRGTYKSGEAHTAVLAGLNTRHTSNRSHRSHATRHTSHRSQVTGHRSHVTHHMSHGYESYNHCKLLVSPEKHNLGTNIYLYYIELLTSFEGGYPSYIYIWFLAFGVGGLGFELCVFVARLEACSSE